MAFTVRPGTEKDMPAMLRLMGCTDYMDLLWYDLETE
jgi:hypothetical protein